MKLALALASFLCLRVGLHAQNLLEEHVDVEETPRSILQEYKNFFILFQLGTGEIVALHAEVQIYRGIYVEGGWGISFIPYSFLDVANRIDGGLTWRWYSQGFTPVAHFQLSKAYWLGSTYDAATNSYRNPRNNGSITSVLVGGEYQNPSDFVVGVTIGGQWWKSRGEEAKSYFALQFCGGISF